ncbi:hypothetical protein [Ferruginibacter profundus]
MFNKLFGRSKKEDDKKEDEKIDLSLGYVRLEEFKDYLINRKYDKFEREYELLYWDAKTPLAQVFFRRKATCVY